LQEIAKRNQSATKTRSTTMSKKLGKEPTLRELGLIGTKTQVFYLILGAVAGTATFALFYFFITELNKVFN
jgi:hypothetical protein